MKLARSLAAFALMASALAGTPATEAMKKLAADWKALSPAEQKVCIISVVVVSHVAKD